MGMDARRLVSKITPCVWAAALLMATGCESQGQNEALSSPDTGVQTETPTPEPVGTIEVSTSKPLATAISPPTVASPKATTVTLAIEEETTPTAIPITPSPTIPPAPHINVDQAPYKGSDCSDKYPCNDDLEAWEARMRVPPDFNISVFGRVEALPTSITTGPDGRLYVSTLDGAIYALDDDGQATLIFNGLRTPTGIAFQPGTQRLYVSSRVDPANIGGIAQVGYIENSQYTQIIGGLPCCYVGMHGPNGIAFGPDGYGYVGVGGRADHGEILVEGPDQGKLDEAHPMEASILRFDPDGGMVEAYAKGFRNPYDIAWDGSGNLYATDNGRDGNPAQGDNPPDELHLVVPGGQHGYPWFDCPVCFPPPAGVEVIPPLLELTPHGAATGLIVYLHNAFQGYYNNLFVLLWSAFEGAQKVIRYDPATGMSSDFATGFAQPIDLTVGPDGNLFIADNATGIIFEIEYAGE